MKSETLEDYVVDLACVRRCHRNDLAGLSQEHTRHCALMGHCVESGYALVNGTGDLFVLDSEATPLVIRALHESPFESGIKLRAEREERDGEMRTVRVDQV